MADEASSEVPDVQSPEVHGITLPRTQLREQLRMLLDCNYILGLRLRDYIMSSGDIPGDHWLNAYKAWSTSVNRLMSEQRWRAKMAAAGGKAGGVHLTDEEYEAELRDLAREVLLEMPPSDLDELITARAAKQLEGGQEDL
jgi:hypothetical protein